MKNFNEVEINDSIFIFIELFFFEKQQKFDSRSLL